MNRSEYSEVRVIQPMVLRALGLGLFLIAGFCLSPMSFSAEPKADEAPASVSSSVGEIELKVWNDPAFKKQFAESYAAETEIEPRVTPSERDQMQKVLDLIAANKMDDAVKQIDKARAKSSSAVFEFTQANIFFQQDKLSEAAVLYQSAVEKFPKFRRAWRNLGLIFVRQGDYEKAVAPLTRVIELGGQDAVTLGLLGFAYSSVGNPLSAESAYRMAILLDPVTIDWKMGLARSFFKQQRYAEALSLCAQLSEKQPDRADLWLLQANAHIGLNQSLKAAEIFELVDTLGQSTPESLALLGDIYINEGLYDSAVYAYVRALYKKAPDNAERTIRSAKVLVARGAHEATGRLIGHIETVFADKLSTEQRKDLLKLRARLAVAAGAGDEEARVLEEIVTLDPLDGEALILLGQHKGRAGDTEKAIFYYERAAAIEAFEADAKVRHAQLLVSKGKYADALPLLRRAQQVKPRDNIQDYLEQVERVSKTR